eukprot:193560_1
MEVLISGYVNHIKKMHNFQMIICKDINHIILSFYIHNLSQYKYLAVFCVINKNSPGHFSAFNIDQTNTDDIKANDFPQCDIFCDNTDIFHESFGTKMTLFELHKFPATMYQNLFPAYQKLNFQNNKHKLHVIFRTEGCKHPGPMTAYLLETDIKYTLPNSSCIDRAALIQSSKYGLIALGGFKKDNKTQYKSVQMLKWNNEDTFIWDKNTIREMIYSRGNHTAHMFEEEEKIFVCGGFYMNAHLVEMYSFLDNKWIQLKSMIYYHECHGLCYDNKRNNMFVVGDFARNPHASEKYDMHKNRWINLPETQYPHRFYPDMKVNNNSVLICTGNHYKYTENNNEWGYSEFLDLRDSKQVWQCNNLSIYQMLKSGNDQSDKEFCQRTMRKIWSL